MLKEQAKPYFRFPNKHHDNDVPSLIIDCWQLDYCDCEVGSQQKCNDLMIRKIFLSLHKKMLSTPTLVFLQINN